MSGNPALSKFTKVTSGPTATFRPPAPAPGQLEQMYNQPSYNGPTGPAAPTRYMTLDDVVMRTGAMLAVLFAAGAVAWISTRPRAPTPA